MYFPLALATGAPTLGNPVGVEEVQRMSTLAMRLLGVQRTLPDSPQDIHGMGYRFHVRRIHAERITTEVVDDEFRL